MPPIKKSPLSSLKTNLKKAVSRGPLWEGPSGTGPNGGITFSALSRFLTCRERFRVTMIEGVKPEEKFNHRLEYGQMWHACEEALAAKKDYMPELVEYVKGLTFKYPMDREQIGHWYQVCMRQFPLYVEYWKKHADVKNRVPLLQEQVFDVPYLLPSGRIVRLRGKWDSVDLLKNLGGIFLKENKSKGDIDEMGLKRQLTFDLQTMLYLVALEKYNWVGTQYGPPQGKTAKLPTILPLIKGVVYNVVRRPLSGGKGSIKRHEATRGSKCSKCKGEGKLTVKSKGVYEGARVYCPKCKGKGYIGGKPEETLEHFYDRAAQYIKDEPETYFMRWTVNVNQADIERFKRECLNPILEQLCDWYDWVSTTDIPFMYFNGTLLSTGKKAASYVHYRHPFGAANSIDEYGFGEVDEHLNTGSMVGMRRVDKLFTELQ